MFKNKFLAFIFNETIPETNPRIYKENPGFLNSLGDGFIVPILLILNILTNKFNIYNIENNGRMYNLGFFIGIMIWAKLLYH